MACLRANSSDTCRRREFGCACRRCRLSAGRLPVEREAVSPSVLFSPVFSQAALRDALAECQTPRGSGCVLSPTGSWIAPATCAPSSCIALAHELNDGADSTSTAARLLPCISPKFWGPPGATTIPSGPSKWTAVGLKFQRLVAREGPLLSWLWWWLD